MFITQTFIVINWTFLRFFLSRILFWSNHYHQQTWKYY